MGWFKDKITEAQKEIEDATTEVIEHEQGPDGTMREHSGEPMKNKWKEY